MKSLLFRIALFAVFAAAILCAASYVSELRNAKTRWDVNQTQNGQWRYVKSVGGEWVEEVYYTEDRESITQRRYWDSYGRMIEIEYGEDGDVIRKSVRE